MDIARIAAMQVAGAAALAQETASMSMMKKAAEAQMQMAKIIAQQAELIKSVEGFSVYG